MLWSDRFVNWTARRATNCHRSGATLYFSDSDLLYLADRHSSADESSTRKTSKPSRNLNGYLYSSGILCQLFARILVLLDDGSRNNCDGPHRITLSVHSISKQHCQRFHLHDFLETLQKLRKGGAHCLLLMLRKKTHGDNKSHIE